MSYIVERLRACHGIISGDPECYCAEAAAEIERLRADLGVLMQRDSRLIERLDSIGEYLCGKRDAADARTAYATLLYVRSILNLDAEEYRRVLENKNAP